MSKRNIIIICIIITIAIFLVFVYYIVNKHNKDNFNSNVSTDLMQNTNKKIEIKDTNIISTSIKEDKVISPKAILEIKQYYKKCGHTIQEKNEVPKDIVNMTRRDVEKYYDGWRIDEFSEDKILIYKENEGVCNEHYIVKDNDGYVTIYNENKDGEESFVRATDILTKYLPDEDKEILKQGIEVIGKQGLEQFLEDFE
ncbi:MAG: BofC C-terminal domain-containing protein [Clostridia bacterium]|nr:BofC C-terminal domain-containing protein [Clostridia bacterium]